jgi:hypothetical protein
MPKFGLFKAPAPGCLVEYEGDYMQMNKEFVEIRIRGTAGMPTGSLVAAIRLDKGQDVRQLKDS